MQNEQTDEQRMLNHLSEIKRHLNITWSDVDTDAKVIDIMLDAEVTLNHLLGAELDYFAPGAERTLFRNYCLYAWNECINEFRKAYKSEIYEIRHKYEVIGEKENEQE